MENILLIDDSKMFKTILANELNSIGEMKVDVHLVNSYKDATDYLSQNSTTLVLAEVNLKSGEESVDFMKKMQSKYKLKHIPCVFMSSEVQPSKIKELYLKKAHDFLKKPFDSLDYFKILNIIEQSIHTKKISDKMIVLSEGMDEAVQVVKERERELIFRLAKSAALRDKETGNHINRVGRYSHALAKEMGLPLHIQELIELASPLHDIGKIAIADSILQKPGKLTDEEYRVMKNHTIYGYKVLYNPNMPLLKMAAEIALNHHEQMDGSGYPYGRKGDEIPMEARITTVADVFDAFSSRRRYKEAWSMDQSFNQLLTEGGTSFDKQVVEAFLDIKPSVLAIYEELKDS